MEQEKNSLLEQFGKEIAKIQERHTKAAFEEFLSLGNPRSNKQIAMKEYYKNTPIEDVILRICQKQIEGVLHDVFFLFEEDKNKKVSVLFDGGVELNLANEYEELRSKPFDWVEEYSKYG